MITLLWNPDNCGAQLPAINATYRALSRCECGRTGYAHSEDYRTEADLENGNARPAPAGAEHTDGADIEACTCGRPVCDDCYQDECPHGSAAPSRS